MVMGAGRHDLDLAALLRAVGNGVSARAYPASAISIDQTLPFAREWLRAWGPARMPRELLLVHCSCVEGRCEVCN